MQVYAEFHNFQQAPYRSLTSIIPFRLTFNQVPTSWWREDHVGFLLFHQLMVLWDLSTLVLNVVAEAFQFHLVPLKLHVLIATMLAEWLFKLALSVQHVLGRGRVSDAAVGGASVFPGCRWG